MESEFFHVKQFFDLKNENPCFVAVSAALKDLVSVADKISSSNAPVLITGEKGTGKRSFAFQIFLRGENKDKKFVIIECKNFPNLNGFDSEFSADNVYFFNEVSFLDKEGQDKLLSFIRQVNEKKLLLKIIVSSCVKLENLVSKNLFNEELFSRLNTLSLRIPPLRNRKEDIVPLAGYFLEQSCNVYGKNIRGFSENAGQSLEEYDWPGNVSELKCVIERACILENQDMIASENLFLREDSFEKVLDYSLQSVFNTVTEDKRLKTALDSFKRAYIIRILKENNWNQTKASRVLDIQRTYVAKLMNELKIRDEYKEK